MKNLKVISNSFEDIRQGKLNAKFNDGVEIIYTKEELKLNHVSSRYLNGKNLNDYTKLLK